MKNHEEYKNELDEISDNVHNARAQIESTVHALLLVGELEVQLSIVGMREHSSADTAIHTALATLKEVLRGHVKSWNENWKMHAEKYIVVVNSYVKEGNE